MGTNEFGRPARVAWVWVFLIVGVIALLLMISRTGLRRSQVAIESGVPSASNTDPKIVQGKGSPPRRTYAAPAAMPTAEVIVAQKLAGFSRSRRELALALARKHGVEMTPEVEAFFAAVASGQWEAIETAYKKISGGDPSAGQGPNRTPEVSKMWPAIVDAYGAAEQVHLWPAQQLLDYGNAILSSLRPGMVYVGGTDNGRWIPELLNETSEGERHIILTQNALADGTYVDYLRLQYPDNFANLSEEDSQRAFDEYLKDARKRLQHDQQFPNEPRQVRPGENIQITENRVDVGGQVAVMSINERLLQTLMQKNPDLMFAMQESFPFGGLYGNALPLGPLQELGANDGQNTFTPERATQSLEYWRSAAEQVLASPDAFGSETTLKSYSHDTAAAANLLAAHHFTAEAEEAYRLAAQLWPANPESVGGLAALLSAQGKAAEARQLLADFQQHYPDQREGMERASSSATLIWARQAGR